MSLLQAVRHKLFGFWQHVRPSFLDTRVDSAPLPPTTCAADPAPLDVHLQSSDSTLLPAPAVSVSTSTSTRSVSRALLTASPATALTGVSPFPNSPSGPPPVLVSGESEPFHSVYQPPSIQELPSASVLDSTPVVASTPRSTSMSLFPPCADPATLVQTPPPTYTSAVPPTSMVDSTSVPKSTSSHYQRVSGADALQRLDEDLARLIGVQGTLFVSALHSDYNSQVTKAACVELIQLCTRVLNLRKPVLRDFTQCLDSIHKMQVSLSASTGYVPADPLWHRFYDSLQLLHKHFQCEHLKLAAQTPLVLPSQASPQLSSSAPVNQSTMLSLNTSSPDMHAQRIIAKCALQGLQDYDGKDFDRWFAHFEQTCTQAGLGFDPMRTLLQAKLGKTHVTKCRNIASLRTWSEVREELSKDLSDTPNVIMAFNQWRQLRQEDRTLSQYIDHTFQLLHRTDSLDDTFQADKITYFIMGLNDVRLRRALLSQLHDRKSFHTNKTLRWFTDNAREKNMVNDMAQDCSTDRLSASHDVLATSHHSRSTHHDNAWRKRPSHQSSSRRPAFGPPQESRLDRNVPCQRHVDARHLNSQCKTPTGYCPHCSERVSDADFISGKHKAACTAPKCHYCHRPGHIKSECKQKQRDDGTHYKAKYKRIKRMVAPSRSRSSRAYFVADSSTDSDSQDDMPSSPSFSPEPSPDVSSACVAESAPSVSQPEVPATSSA